MTRTPAAAQPQTASRQAWMQVLARAGEHLESYAEMLQANKYRHVREPETGMIMVRARMGGDGAPFNLGEMTVTRCVVQLEDGTTGHSYVAGRSRLHAELAALADALLQREDSQQWREAIIAPLHAKYGARAARQAAEVGATRVDFTTLVRGEG